MPTTIEHSNGIARPVLLDHNGHPWREGSGRAAAGLSVPHFATFAAKQGSGHAYWHDKFDEAVRHAREDAAAMRHDALLMALVDERKRAVSSLAWHIAVPDEKDPVQKRVKDGITRVIEGIPCFRHMVWWLLDALWYGRSAVQVAWKWGVFNDRHPKEDDGAQPQAPVMPGMPPPPPPKKKPYDKGKPRRCLTISQDKPDHGPFPVNGDKIGHTYDHVPYVLVAPSETDKLRGAATVSTTVGGLGLLLEGSWRERFLIHKHLIEDTDYFSSDAAEAIHGVGIRSKVFWPNWLKLDCLSDVMAFYDRVGLGVTIWKFPQGNPQALEAVKQAAREQSERAHLFVPFDPAQGRDNGSGVERLEVPTSGAEALMRLIEYYDGCIERYVVGQEGSASATSSSGHSNHASADFMESTKAQIAQQDAHFLACSLTGNPGSPGLVSMIQRYTFPWAKDFVASLVFAPEQTQEAPEKLQAAQTLVQMGLKLKADEVRAAAGFSKPDDGDELVEMPQQPGGAPGGMPGMGGAPGAAPGGDPMAAMMGGAGAGAEGGAAPGQEGDFLKQLQGDEESGPQQQQKHPPADLDAAFSDPDVSDWMDRIGPKGGHWKVNRKTGKNRHVARHARAGQPLRYAAEGEQQSPWTGPFRGPRGGTFWVNSRTGAREWGAERPASHRWAAHPEGGWQHKGTNERLMQKDDPGEHGRKMEWIDDREAEKAGRLQKSAEQKLPFPLPYKRRMDESVKHHLGAARKLLEGESDPQRRSDIVEAAKDAFENARRARVSVLGRALVEHYCDPDAGEPWIKQLPQWRAWRKAGGTNESGALPGDTDEAQKRDELIDRIASGGITAGKEDAAWEKAAEYAMIAVGRSGRALRDLMQAIEAGQNAPARQYVTDEPADAEFPGAFPPDDRPRSRAGGLEQAQSLPDELKGLSEDADGRLALGGKRVDRQEEKAVRDYVGEGYREVNRYLRGDGNLREQMRDDEEFHGRHQKMHEGLQSLFAKIQPSEKPITVYRGVRLDHKTAMAFLDRLKAAHAAGEPIRFQGYSSCSHDPTVAAFYGDQGKLKEHQRHRGEAGNNVVMEIAAKKGLNLGGGSADVQGEVPWHAKDRAAWMARRPKTPESELSPAYKDWQARKPQVSPELEAKYQTWFNGPDAFKTANPKMEDPTYKAWWDGWREPAYLPHSPADAAALKKWSDEEPKAHESEFLLNHDAPMKVAAIREVQYENPETGQMEPRTVVQLVQDVDLPDSTDLQREKAEALKTGGRRMAGKGANRAAGALESADNDDFTDGGLEEWADPSEDEVAELMDSVRATAASIRESDHDDTDETGWWHGTHAALAKQLSEAVRLGATEDNPVVQALWKATERAREASLAFDPSLGKPGAEDDEYADEPKTLADAMKKYRGQHAGYHRGRRMVGESVGELDDALESIGDHHAEADPWEDDPHLRSAMSEDDWNEIANGMHHLWAEAHHAGNDYRGDYDEVAQKAGELYRRLRGFGVPKDDDVAQNLYTAYRLAAKVAHAKDEHAAHGKADLHPDTHPDEPAIAAEGEKSRTLGRHRYEIAKEADDAAEEVHDAIGDHDLGDDYDAELTKLWESVPMHPERGGDLLRHDQQGEWDAVGDSAATLLDRALESGMDPDDPLPAALWRLYDAAGRASYAWYGKLDQEPNSREELFGESIAKGKLARQQKGQDDAGQ